MMQRPGKTFGALLRVRRRREDLQARVLAEARREAAGAERQREALGEARRRALEEAGARASGGFDAGEVRRYYQYERHLAGLNVAKDAELRELRAREEAERGALEEAMKARRVVERLIERREQVWAREMNRAEQKVTDEVGATRAARARGREGERREDA